MRLTIRPITDPHVEIDVTERVLAAIAEQIAAHVGGNASLNHLEAAIHLQRWISSGTGVQRTDGARPTGVAP